MEITWAEFLTLDADVLDYAMQLHFKQNDLT
jgi:hypothetical protein